MRASLPRPVLVLLAGVALVAALVLAACGGDAEEPGAEATTSSSTAAGTGSTNPTTPATLPATDPVPGAPVVVFAGDSVLHSLATAMTAAWGDHVATSYVGVPRITGRPASELELQEHLAAQPADVVVVMVGRWEDDVVEQEGDWQASYLGGLQPFLDVVPEGTPVVWMAYPLPQDEEEQVGIDGLNSSWATLPGFDPQVRFTDATTAVTPDGEFHTLLDGPDGGPLLVRQLDGRHLCPDGVVLVAEALLADLQPEVQATTAPGWQDGAWRTDTATFARPELCPPDLAG